MTKSLEKSMERLAEVTRLQNNLKEEAEKLKGEIARQMVKTNTKKLATDSIAVTYIDGTVRHSFDTKKFKEAHPKMYKDFLKISIVSESLRVALK